MGAPPPSPPCLPRGDGRRPRRRRERAGPSGLGAGKLISFCAAVRGATAGQCTGAHLARASDRPPGARPSGWPDRRRPRPSGRVCPSHLPGRRHLKTEPTIKTPCRLDTRHDIGRLCVLGSRTGDKALARQAPPGGLEAAAAREVGGDATAATDVGADPQERATGADEAALAAARATRTAGLVVGIGSLPEDRV